MEEKVYVKGDRNEVVKRFRQIHTIRMRCPSNDESVKCLRTVMATSLIKYIKNHDSFNEIPVDDVFNVFMYTLTFCRDNGVDVDILYVIIGCLQSFKGLKYISIDFVDDNELYNAYVQIKDNVGTDDVENKTKVIRKIYDVNVLEMNLTDMFSQEIIDIFNKHMMTNGLLKNSFLNREFYVNFDYDGYVAYMDMFLGNNVIEFDSMDNNIIDYFRLFPVFIAEQKPLIRIITNYSEI